MKNNHLLISTLALLLSCCFPLSAQTSNMILVEGGKVKMTVKEPVKLNTPEKKTEYQVTVSSFEMNKYEVSVGEWKEYVKVNELKMPARPTWGWNDEKPITNVTWVEAIQYCNWLSTNFNLKPAYKKQNGQYIFDITANGYRLPTDAEWVYAAKGGNKSKNYIYSGGNDLEAIAWYSKNSKKEPKTYGTKLPNEIGLYDMSGNVFEWCWDTYDPFFYKIDTKINPKGPDRGDKRCIRGGSWDSSNLNYLKPDHQLNWVATSSNAFFGFRVVRSVVTK